MGQFDFEFLFTKIGPNIKKQDTNMRQSILINRRLKITLRFFTINVSEAWIFSLKYFCLSDTYYSNK